MLDYETKMAEIRRIQEEKLAKQRERAQARDMDIAQKRQEVTLLLFNS